MNISIANTFRGLAAGLVLSGILAGCVSEPDGVVTECVIPLVVSTDPAANETNVPVSKTSATSRLAKSNAIKIITATFNTPMDPASINNSTFFLMQGSDTIAGAVSYSDTTAVFTAPDDLLPNTVYTATLTTGVRERSLGMPMEADYVWTFTTIDSTTPTLISPANGAVNQAVNPNLVWSAVPGAATYRLQVSLTPTFLTTVYNDSTRTAPSQIVSGLAYATTYYWRVNAKIAGETGDYSSVWSFTTVGIPAAPVLIAPAASAQNQSTSPSLSWNASVGADTYRLQVSTSPLFLTPLFDDSTLTGTSRIITGLALGTTYYWRVNAKNGAGTSAYSTRDFTTIGTAPQPPVLASPANGSTNHPQNPTLRWNASTGAATYRVQLSTSPTFLTTLVDDSTVTGTARALSGLTLGTTYYWRVNAKNAGGTSVYSTTWSFTVAATQPSVNLASSAKYGGMGGSAGITNQGLLTQINGSLSTTAVSTMVTGFHDGTTPPSNSFTETPLNAGNVRDTIYTATAPPGSIPGAVATQALADANAAYLYLAGLPPGSDPGAGELGGLTLAPGTYTAASGSFAITLLDLTLDAQGNPNAQFVFQVPSSLTVGSAGPVGARSVLLINGAQAKNVFWQVGAAATINGAGGGTMVGTVIAQQGVTLSTAGNVTLTRLEGRALSLISSVTMVNTVINVPLP
jgi:hypothetical protein